MSAAIRELNISDYGNTGPRSPNHPRPDNIDRAKVRPLPLPNSQPPSADAPAADEREGTPSSGLEPRHSGKWEEGIPTRSKSLERSIAINSTLSPLERPDRSMDNSFLLANPESLPFRDLSKIARQRVTIVAPHPDDETLGCGGAISLMCRKGYDVRVLVISDGTLSHPNSRKYPAPALQSLRARETQTALARLGVNRSAITFLGLKDGSVPTLTAANFHTAKLLCQNYLRVAAPDTIFLPWRFDPHPDHRATWQLIQAAILSLGLTPQTIEYPIWDWDLQQQKAAPHLDKIAGWRLDIGAALDVKLKAIGAYRSQLGLLIDDDPTGFCLTAELLTNFTRPWEVYFEEIL
jgi:LmbE family N-acetylglucosaminyl deacetylase